MKTSELIGAELDWAVAKCEGFGDSPRSMEIFMYQQSRGMGYCYCTDWAKGGAIIARENINFWTSNSWQDERGNFTSIKTAKHPTSTQHHNGETPLIAAMRCYVSSKLGDEVELPEELGVIA
jgi:hypothetical protein